MSDIKQRIERVKKLREQSRSGNPLILGQYRLTLDDSIMPIIEAYEESQARVESLSKKLELSHRRGCNLVAELETAYKRIGELAKQLDKLQIEKFGGLKSL